MVTNNQSIIGSVSSIIESIQPEKRALKEKYFRKEAAKTLLPKSISRLHLSESKHVTNTLRNWGMRAGIPMDDINVLMNILGSLEKIVTADENLLDSIPINSSSKLAIIQFFKSPSVLEEGTYVTNDNEIPVLNDQPQSNQSLCNGSQSQPNQHGVSDIYRDEVRTDPNIPARNLVSSSHMVIPFCTNHARKINESFNDETSRPQFGHPNYHHQYTIQSMQSRHEDNIFSAYRYQNFTTQASAYNNQWS